MFNVQSAFLLAIPRPFLANYAPQNPSKLSFPFFSLKIRHENQFQVKKNMFNFFSRRSFSICVSLSLSVLPSPFFPKMLLLSRGKTSTPLF